jgi:plastocyanin
MRLSRSRSTAAALVVAAGAALTWGGAQAVAVMAPAAGPSASASAAKVRKVKMFDNYYSPAKLTVHKGTKVQWVWPSDVGDSHDVKVKKGPKGAKKFASPPFAAAARWPRPPMAFKKTGTYKLYCTFHETEMTMTIVVKK